MKLFNGIIGVLSIFGALYCIFWGDASFLNYGWIVTLVLTLLGLCAVITYAIDRKEAREKDADIAATGVSGLVCGIAVLVISIVAQFNAKIQALFLLVVFLVFVVFMFISGIKYIVSAVKTKKSENKDGWVLLLVLGIILLGTGIGGLISAFALNALNGINMGIMLGIFGLALLASIFTRDNVSRYDEV